MKAERIELTDINVHVCIYPVCAATNATTFRFAKIHVSNIGTKNNGVYLYELIAILVKAIIVCIIKGAPTMVQVALLTVLPRALCEGLEETAVQFQVHVGDEFQVVGDFAESFVRQALSSAASSIVERVTD